MVRIPLPLARSPIRHLEQRIGRHLQQNRPGIFPDRTAHRIRIGRIDIGRLQPLPGKNLVDDPERAAVEILGYHYMIALLEKQQEIGDRRHPRCVGKTSNTTVQLGYTLLQNLAGGIAASRIVISGALT
jgi:hypothetical protein